MRYRRSPPVFQSTLPRGSDLLLCKTIWSICNFNPRSLAGATSWPYGPFLISEVFQSTLPRGSDAGYNLFRSPTLEFQSTLPRGSDRISVFLMTACLDFNPRSLAGATLATVAAWRAAELISIHAPSRERPAGYNLFRSPTLEFQSTLPRGSDQQS